MKKKNNKVGIFIHWGVYSVPAFGNEWYPRNMYIKGSKENLHHEEKYGTLDKFGYKDFIPQFKAEKFDPKEWLAAAKSANTLRRPSAKTLSFPTVESRFSFAFCIALSENPASFSLESSVPTTVLKFRRKRQIVIVP